MNRKTYKRIISALFLIGIGTVLLFNNLQLLPFALPDYVFTWKALMVIIGFYLLIGHFSFSGMIFMLVGGYLLIPEIPELASYNIQAFWPVILILLGVVVMLRGFFKPRCRKKNKRFKRMETSVKTDTTYLNSSVIFAGKQEKVSSYDFQGGKISAICGGLELDLTDCYLNSENKTILDVNVVCGGISMKVSKEWNIKIDINAIMGGVEDQITEMPGTYVDPAAELVLTGTLVMGGIEIKRV